MNLAWMRWTQNLFFHWAFDPTFVRPLVPRRFELDLHDGLAHVSLVALRVVGPAPRSVARSRLAARLLGYAQLDLRTYVIGPRGPGVFLLETRVDHRWPTVARLSGFPYRRDRELAVGGLPRRARVEARGVSLRGAPVSYARPAVPEPGSRDEYLLDRYLTYGVLPGGAIDAFSIAHAPWRTVLLSVTSGSLPGLPLVHGTPMLAHAAAPMLVAIETAAVVAPRPQPMDLRDAFLA